MTLSDEYHGGVGYSFLWKKKKKKKMNNNNNDKTEGVVGWASQQAKKYDPRLGIDPATGVNYVDPETGKMWIHPDLVEQSGGESKKRGVSGTTPESVAKKMKSDDKLEQDVSVSEQEPEQDEKEEGEVTFP